MWRGWSIEIWNRKISSLAKEWSLKSLILDVHEALVTHKFLKSTIFLWIRALPYTHPPNNSWIKSILSSVMFGLQVVCYFSYTLGFTRLWMRGLTILLVWLKKWLRINRLSYRPNLTLRLPKSFRWHLFTKIRRGPHGDSCGCRDCLLIKLPILRDTLIIWRMWQSLRTGWPNNFGKSESSSVFPKIKIKYLCTLSLNFNIPPSKWPSIF
jgi:hypothetical protein